MATGLLTRPEKRTRPESRSQIKKMKGRVAWNEGPFKALERSMTTAVAAAASVPSSFTSTKAKNKNKKQKQKTKNKNENSHEGDERTGRKTNLCGTLGQC